MDTFTVLLITPGGDPPEPFAERLTRLGGEVRHASASPESLDNDSDLIALDLRDAEAIPAEMVELLLADSRPIFALAPRLSATVQRLAQRAAGTMLMTGREKESGYRVALRLCRCLNAMHSTLPSLDAPRATFASGPVPGSASLGA